MAFDAGAAVGRITLDDSQYQAGVKRVSAGQKILKTGAAAVGAAFVAAAVAVSAGIIKSIRAADEWQKSFSNVTTLLDTAKVNTQAMAKELLGLDARLGSSKDLTEGLYQAISASVEPAKAVEFVAKAAEFARAALTDTNTAVDVITTGLNAYGLEAEKATEISDQLFSVIRLGKTTGAELAAVIGQSIPLAANMGIEFAELGASMAVMTRQGVSASEATTQFNGVVNSFLKPSEDMIATLKEMGFESGQAAIETLGVKGTLDKLVKSTGGSKEALAGLFNNTRALRGVMALTGKGASDFNEVLDQIRNSAGATNEAFNKQEITFETLKNTMGNMSVIVGNIGKSFADELAVGATDAANSMIQFLLSGEGAQIVSDVIAGVTAAFDAFKTFVDPIVESLLPALQSIWGEVANAANVLGGDLGDASGAFNIFGTASHLAASLITIFGKQIAGVIENVINLVDAIKKSGGIIGKFFDFITGKAKWGEVTDQISAAGDAFAKFGTDALENVTDLVGGIIDEISGFGEEASSLSKNIEISWSATFNRTKTNVINNYDEMTTGQKSYADAVITSAQAAADALSNMSSDVADSAARNTQTAISSAEVMWDAVRNASMEAAAKQKEAMSELRAEYQKTAEKYADSFLPVFQEIGSLLTDQEKSWEDVKKAALAAIASIVEGFAQQWAVQAAAEWAAVAGGAVIRIPAALGYTAAAAAAEIAAGAIRGLRTGGLGAGPTIVGEEGPELVNLPGGSRVFSTSQTRNMIRGGNVTNNYYVRDESDFSRINRQQGRAYASALRGI